MTAEQESQKKPAKPQWAINRDVENWLGVSMDAPREDQKGHSDDLSPPSSTDQPKLLSKKDRGEPVMVITYNPKNRTVTYQMADKGDSPSETEEQLDNKNRDK